jgi:hypothetical protein
MSHSPGPWTWNHDMDGPILLRADNGALVLNFEKDYEQGPSNEDARLMESSPDLLAMLVRLQVALGDFCCAVGISYDDMEDEHKELLDASNAADELIKQVKGVL